MSQGLPAPWCVTLKLSLAAVVLHGKNMLLFFKLPGAAGAPKMGDKAAWAPRIGKGLDTLVASATKGLNAMPPKGGYSGSDAEFRAAVEYIVGNSK